MRAKKYVLVWLLFASAVSAQSQGIKIAEEVRVTNPNPAQSWWAAASTIGGYSNIPQLRELAIKAGQQPATKENILAAAKAHCVGIQWSPHGNSKNGIDWITKRLEAKQPVVVGTRDAYTNRGQHTFIILTWVSKEPQHHDNDKGFRTFDYLVNFVDPTNGRNYQYPLASLYRVWDGSAWAFDQEYDKRADPPTPLAAGPPIGPPPVVPLPEYSNQDIKDGVRRPDDTLRYGLYGHAFIGHDYYREFNGKKP